MEQQKNVTKAAWTEFLTINRKFVVTPFASERNSSSIRTRSTSILFVVQMNIATLQILARLPKFGSRISHQ